MPRKIFDRELSDLISSMAETGNAVQSRIQKTVTALRTSNITIAGEVAGSDGEIDRMIRQCEKKCMDLIVLQQPIAKDFRVIAACLKILTDVEREADQCADICEILTTGELKDSCLAAAHVAAMLETAGSMFRRSMNVLLNRDVSEARRICRTDDEVDLMFSRIILEVSSIISENPGNVMKEVDLLFITKYAERMGDHATNIAEWVIFMETGEHPDLNAK